MRLYLAVGDTRQYFNLLREENQKNVLISYAYFSSPEEYLKVSGGWWPEQLILDSGAFTVWTKGGSVNLDNYADYCLKMRITAPDTTTIYNVNLDVLPGRFGQHPTDEEREESARKGLENAHYLENKGLKVLPVFHQHEDFKWLDLMAKDYEYFGISPANDVSMKEKVKWLRKVFSKIKATRKTHGFGATAPQITKQFPLYSADSSSWTAGSRFARIPTFNQGIGRSVNFKDKEAFLQNWDRLANKDTALLTNYLEAARAGIRTFQEMERFVTMLWDSRNITWT